MKNPSSDGRRVARAEKEVQQTVASFLVKGFKIPLHGIVTISQVKMSKDLKSAKVYVSVLGTDKEKVEAVQTLQKHVHEVQRYIGDHLKMRYCPKLTFFPDNTTEQVLKIEKILNELKIQDNKNNEE